MNGVIISEEEHVVLVLEASREKWVTTSYGTSIRLLPIPENRWAIERIAELRGVSLAS